MGKTLKRIGVSGGAGQIAYSLLFRLAAGELLGGDQDIALHILEVPGSMGALEGVAMELDDCAFPRLNGVKIGSDPKDVFGGVDYLFLVGAKPRGPGMERKELLAENGKIFVEQGRAINEVAQNALTLVVGNPCNTNCLIALKNAPKVDKKRFFAMTRLDQNRAAAMLAKKAGVSVNDVSQVTIWGNHSSTQVPDFVNAKIKGRPALEVINDRKWCEEVFIPGVQKRGAAVIAARGKSSAASAAEAALEGMRSLIFPTEWFSMGVYSNGNPYGVKEDLIFSFPCRSKGEGEVEMIPGVPWDDFLKARIALTEKELLEERELAL